MSTAVITDSTATLPAAVVAEHGIRVVPLQLVIDGGERIEGDGADASVVVDALHPMPDVTQLQPGDTVTLVPPVEPGVGWVAGPFAAAVVYWCTNLVALQGQPQR